MTHEPRPSREAYQSRISQEIRRLRKQQAARKPKRSRTPSRAPSELPPLKLEEARKLWEGWFEKRGWSALPFQRQCWEEFLKGRSGLLSVSTGSGKTYAALGGPLMQMLATPSKQGQELRLIYVSPLKALVRDVALAVEKPLRDLNLPLTVEVRTGDTTPAQRAQLRKKLPSILITTPESLALLLAEAGAKHRLAGVECIVVDEWHELLGSKRGSLLELTLARLRFLRPGLRTWALSATIGNLEVAARVAAGLEAVIINERLKRPVGLHSILPQSVSAFPWFGHSGLGLHREVVANLDTRVSSVIFTNTRNQAERWYQQLLRDRPEWKKIMALHHGSLDRDERERVENGIKSGALKVVVATSSLDLGVDFPQVEKVIQVGSAKGLGRAIQRAGRAFHRPGEATELWVCPTHLLEILEISALREGLKQGVLEERVPRTKPMDVLVQFLLNSAFGDGFTREEIQQTIHLADSFKSVTDEELDWALNLVTEGGYSLQAYPQFRKLQLNENRYQFVDARLARMHRLNIGTILSDGGILVQFAKGAKLGSIDEGFVARLRKGDVFYFAGRKLQLIQIRDMKATVRLAGKEEGPTPVWNGTLLPITPSLSRLIRQEVSKLAEQLEPSNPEMTAFQTAADEQRKLSALPRAEELLIESYHSREGYHLFVYPFAGRSVHEGLGHLVALRLSRLRPNTISVSANDFGFELLATEPMGRISEIHEALSDTSCLIEDIEESANLKELAKRVFREVARVSGLIQQGSPYEMKSLRHLQMSSSLLFDVFMKYDPGHLLVKQAFQEVREQQLELGRLKEVMESLSGQKLLFQEIRKLTPFAFPLFIERIKSRQSSEKLEDRIARIQRQLLS